MANVINKNTLQYLKSVNTPDYTEEDWIINPVLPDCDKKYWKVKNNKVVEMTIAEKKTINDNIKKQTEQFEKEQLIEQKKETILRNQAIDALKNEGKLDADGSLVKQK